MKNKLSINIVSTFLLQFVTIVSGFIIPKSILAAFGSEVNGLISSLTQFLNYINLIEGGVSSVIMSSLYTPLFEKNQKKIDGIVTATLHFFRKLSLIFVIYTFILATIYPLAINSSFSWKYVSSLTLILSISLLVQYCFSLTWKLLLQADQKVYIVSFIQILVIILNTIFTIIGIKLFSNIHLVKLISAVAFLIQPLLINYFVKKYYKINLEEPPDKDALKNRWDGFGINIAAFLNGNTDVMVLTVLSTLKNVSIYSIYSLVVTGIKSLITSISSGIIPSLGNYYAEGNKKKLNNFFNFYELLIYYFTFSVYSCAVILIVPFVLVYTSGIHDANYDQAIFSILLILSIGVFCLREPYVNMAYVAGKFKEVSKFAYVEAVINIVVSVIAVSKFGLNGVAFGTLCSMSFRTICQICYLKKNILFRNISKVLKKLSIYLISSLVGIFLCKYINFGYELTWIGWFIFAIKNAVVIFTINSVVTIIFFRDELRLKKRGT